MKTSRRRFISFMGLLGFGVISQRKSESLEIDINRFNNNTNINLSNVEIISFKIKDMTITAENINSNKDAKLDVYGRIDGNDIGKIKTYNINIKDDKTNLNDQFSDSELIIKLNNARDFDKKYISEETYNNQDSITCGLIFELDHPSIDKTISEVANYNLGISDSNSELIENSYSSTDEETTITYSSSTKDSAEKISGSNLNVLNKTGFDQVKRLVRNGPLINKTSTTFEPGGIDISDESYENSSPRNYQNLSYEDRSEVKNYSGSNLSVLNETGFDQVKQLVSNGSLVNKTSTTFESGGIDISDESYENSSPRKYQNLSNSEPDNTKYNIA